MMINFAEGKEVNSNNFTASFHYGNCTVLEGKRSRDVDIDQSIGSMVM